MNVKEQYQIRHIIYNEYNKYTELLQDKTLKSAEKQRINAVRTTCFDILNQIEECFKDGVTQ